MATAKRTTAEAFLIVFMMTYPRVENVRSLYLSVPLAPAHVPDLTILQPRDGPDAAERGAHAVPAIRGIGPRVHDGRVVPGVVVVSGLQPGLTDGLAVLHALGEVGRRGGAPRVEVVVRSDHHAKAAREGAVPAVDGEPVR